MNGVPSGFAAVALARCERLLLLADGQGLQGCVGATVSAGVLPNGLAVFHALIDFDGQEQAASALQRASELLEKNQTHGFEDIGVRQEGDKLRVRAIVNVSKFANAFQLFAADS